MESAAARRGELGFPQGLAKTPPALISSFPSNSTRKGQESRGKRQLLENCLTKNIGLRILARKLYFRQSLFILEDSAAITT
jgi:hypothetical protein